MRCVERVLGLFLLGAELPLARARGLLTVFSRPSYPHSSFLEYCNPSQPQVTVDLDVLVRQRLLNFLVEETTTRDATILYATHIFDGLDSFPTHLCHLQLGATLPPSPLAWPVVFPADADEAESVHGVPSGVRERMEDPARPGSKLLELALAWLALDKDARVAREIAVGGTRKRGAQKRLEGETSDSEAFYRK